MATALQLTKEWQTLCNLQGMNPAVLLNYTCTITAFGGTGNTTYADFGGIKAHASNVPSIILPFDGVIVSAGVKYVNHDDTVDQAGSLSIQAAASPGQARGATANFASVGELIGFTNAELVVASTNPSKTATGLSLSVLKGSCLAVRCVATGAVDNGDSDSQLVISFQLAVPQSQFALPVVS